jgi:hypothetical protein
MPMRMVCVSVCVCVCVCVWTRSVWRLLATAAYMCATNRTCALAGNWLAFSIVHFAGNLSGIVVVDVTQLRLRAYAVIDTT